MDYLGVSKVMVPPNHQFNRVFHEINHPFWGVKTPYFWKHPFQIKRRGLYEAFQFWHLLGSTIVRRHFLEGRIYFTHLGRTKKSNCLKHESQKNTKNHTEQKNTKVLQGIQVWVCQVKITSRILELQIIFETFKIGFLSLTHLVINSHHETRHEMLRCFFLKNLDEKNKHQEKNGLKPSKLGCLGP